eukprot:SM000001S04413  [mRNA]  locus=s1:1028:2732:- [translate_table: standard]
MCNVLRAAHRRRAANEERAGVLYSVGSVIRHRKYGYRGVIFGWDRICSRPIDWMVRMRIFDLPSGADQPFYHVLPDEVGREASQPKYVAQDNIDLLPGERVRHRGIGEYFDKYSEGLRRYIPVLHLKFLFPDVYDEDDPAAVPGVGALLSKRGRKATARNEDTASEAQRQRQRRRGGADDDAAEKHEEPASTPRPQLLLLCPG